MRKMKTEDVLRFLSPIVLSYFVAMRCKVGRDAGKRVKARPPAWVFGVVWPILYLLIGFSWIKMKNTRFGDTLFILNLVGLLLWLIVYGCLNEKKISLYIISALFGLSLTMMIYSMTKNAVAGLALAPYTTWLFYATLLSFWDLNL